MRRCVYFMLMLPFQIDETPPAPECAHRQRTLSLLQILLDDGTALAKRRITILFTLLPGCWASGAVLVYFASVDIDGAGGLDAALSIWALEVALALYPCATRIFPRSRWMLSCSPVSETTLWFCCHQLEPFRCFDCNHS